MSTVRTLSFLLGLTALFLMSCGPGGRGNDDDSADDDDDDDDGDPCEGVTAVSGTAVTLQTFASGFDSPVHITSPNDGSGRLFVLEQRGRIFELDASGAERREYLRIDGNVDSSGEAG